MARPHRTTTQRGLGYAHRQQVATLFSRLRDETPCWWCARPMYRDPAKNFDEAMLEGDHSKARSHGGRIADRLLHSTCNRSRGDGSKDDQRPAVTGKQVETGTSSADLGVLAMKWPR